MSGNPKTAILAAFVADSLALWRARGLLHGRHRGSVRSREPGAVIPEEWLLVFWSGSSRTDVGFP